MRRIAIIAAVVVMMSGGLAVAAEANFNDLSLSANSYWNGSDGSGGFASGGISFNNSYTDWGGGYYSWGGWSYSNVNDTTTAGYGNQYAAYTGTGYGGSGNYAIGYCDAYGASPLVTFSSPTEVSSACLTNTTYTALSMLNGDAFAKKFGGVTGNDADWLLLTMTGYDSGGAATGTVEFYLADYRFTNNAFDYIVDDWTQVNLSSLGTVNSLGFSLTSSDTGAYGINTPTYFAMDSLTTTPEPATMAFLAIGGALAVLRRKRARVCRKAVRYRNSSGGRK